MDIRPSPHDPPLASVLVCTTRPESYAALVASLAHQTEVNYELITIPELGPLAALRNQGLRVARAPVVCVIDDDTVLPPGWLAGVLDTLRRHPEAVGVSGPAIIPPAWRIHRALFRHRGLQHLYTFLFLDGNRIPGTISRAGAPTTCAAEATCAYEGPVAFLEACNMSFRTDALRRVGGFDERYLALGEFSEPDVAYRLRALDPRAVCWFTPQARLDHHPAGGVATLRRRETRTRLANYHLFAAQWVQPCWRHTAYRAFLRTYYALLGWRIISP